MQPLDLIASAKVLLGKGKKGPPRQSDLKRAQSTAYYAMFHALCRNCADSFIEGPGSQRSQPAWRQANRAAEHGFAKNLDMRRSAMEKFPAKIQDFAYQFVQLQLKRHKADYDPFSKFARQDVQMSIDTAESAIRDLLASDSKDRTAFAAWTAMKMRSD